MLGANKPTVFLKNPLNAPTVVSLNFYRIILALLHSKYILKLHLLFHTSVNVGKENGKDTDLRYLLLTSLRSLFYPDSVMPWFFYKQHCD